MQWNIEARRNFLSWSGLTEFFAPKLSFPYRRFPHINQSPEFFKSKVCKASSCLSLTQFSIMYLHHHNDDMHIFWMKNTCPQAQHLRHPILCFNLFSWQKKKMLRQQNLRKYQIGNSFRVFYLLFIRRRWHISVHWCGNWCFLNFHHRQWCFRFGKWWDGVIHRCSFACWLGSFSCLITQLDAFSKTDSLENTLLKLESFRTTREFSVWDFVRKTNDFRLVAKGLTACLNILQFIISYEFNLIISWRFFMKNFLEKIKTNKIIQTFFHIFHIFSESLSFDPKFFGTLKWNFSQEKLCFLFLGLLIEFEESIFLKPKLDPKRCLKS